MYHVTHPAEFLRDLTLVDTPGTNAALAKHEAITAQFLPRADLVLFVTSAVAPLGAAELSFLTAIRDWGKKVVIVVNKIDLVTAAEQSQVCSFVREHARAAMLLPAAPLAVSAAATVDDLPLFATSARAGVAARSQPADVAQREWAASGMRALEAFVVGTLTAAERLRLKLGAPLRVGHQLAEKYRAVAQQRRDLLRSDEETLTSIESQLTAFESDMSREFSLFEHRIEAIMGELAARGELFVTNNFSVWNVWTLSRPAAMRQRFEQDVVGDAPAQLERCMSDVADWLVDRARKQWGFVHYFLQQQAAKAASPAPTASAHPPGEGDATRSLLLTRLQTEASSTITADSMRSERADALSAALRGAFGQAIAASSLGVGAAAAIGAGLLDVTGFVAAGALAAVAVVVLPVRRRAALQDLRRRMEGARDRAVAAVRQRALQETARNVSAMRSAVQPFARYVRTETQRADTALNDLALVAKAAQSLALRVDREMQGRPPA